MQWEQLTSTDLGRAARETGVCILAAGVLERHSEHLTLGTDYLNAHAIACLAAEREPAVVFPPFYFGQIYEARCFPGAVTLRPQLLLELFLGVFDEIARNGFHKIVLYNGHGGNNHLVPFLAQCTLWEEKPYALYLPAWGSSPERAARRQAILETEHHGHACECETSMTMANYPNSSTWIACPTSFLRPWERERPPGALPAFEGIATIQSTMWGLAPRERRACAARYAVGIRRGHCRYQGRRRRAHVESRVLCARAGAAQRQRRLTASAAEALGRTPPRDVAYKRRGR